VRSTFFHKILSTRNAIKIMDSRKQNRNNWFEIDVVANLPEFPSSIKDSLSSIAFPTSVVSNEPPFSEK